VADTLGERERDFWDHHVPSLAECIAEYERGPDAYVREMLDAVSPGPGSTIVDFACGTGVTSAWLAARGADVVAVDLSPVSIRRANELRDALGLRFETRVVGAKPEDLNLGVVFDGLVGRFALHHLDLATYAPALASVLRPGGTAAFVETMATNPLLRFSRRNLVGRPGIRRLGTLDEHPLTTEDIAFLGETFGTVDVRVPQVTFFHLIDRQILRGKIRSATRALNAIDRRLHAKERTRGWSYLQVVVLHRR
jgi:SAM-dependent methyltransferase